MIILSIFIIFGAILNRARGTRFWKYFDSTSATRWFFSFLMGCMAAFIVSADFRLGMEVLLLTTFTMYLWCVFGWDSYWSAAIGHGLRSRLWGLKMLTLRHSLGMPCLIGLSLLTGHWTLFIAGPLLFGLPYFIFGYLTPNKAVNNAEMVIGAVWVFLIIFILR